MDLVSIVVTTKNEERNIRRCLQSISDQTYSEIEIILVDNNSSDQTQEIAAEYTDKIYCKGPERSAQRNYGLLNSASGRFSMYLDADMIITPMLVETCVEHIKRTDDVALFISEKIVGTSFISRVRAFERGFYDGTVIDGSRFFHSDKLKKTGGFDEALFVQGSGEDWDLDKSLKLIGPIGMVTNQADTQTTIWSTRAFLEDNVPHFDPNFNGVYHNESEIRIVPYLSKKLYYAKGFAGYKKKWGLTDPDIIKQFGFRYRFLTVFVENGKWRRLVLAPHLFLSMMALRVMVGVVYFWSKRSAR